MHACVQKSLQSYPSFFNPMDWSFSRLLCPWDPGKGYWWVALLCSRESSQLKDKTRISYVPVFAGGSYTTSATWKAHFYKWVTKCKVISVFCLVTSQITAMHFNMRKKVKIAIIIMDFHLIYLKIYIL